MNRSDKIRLAASRRDDSRDGAAPSVRRPFPKRNLPCIHEGAILEFCTTCKGQAAELRHVRDCGIHDRCTRGPNSVGMDSCFSCKDYDSGFFDPAGFKSNLLSSISGLQHLGRLDFSGSRSLRHLVYHIMPVAGSLVWKLGIDQLRVRWKLFTGRKVVAVVAGTGLEHPDVVRDYLPADVEMFVEPNNPDLREVVTWNGIWDRLLPLTRSHDVVFYAHSKGTTRPLDPGNMCHPWASLSYSVCLDHWPLVDEHLSQFSITGPFLKVGLGFGGMKSFFHYSGTFFWMRARELWERVQRVPMPRHRYAVEAWPGIAYQLDEASCLFLRGRVPKLDLYDPKKWPKYREEYSQWLVQNPPSWPWVQTPV